MSWHGSGVFYHTLWSRIVPSTGFSYIYISSVAQTWLILRQSTYLTKFSVGGGGGGGGAGKKTLVRLREPTRDWETTRCEFHSSVAVQRPGVNWDRVGGLHLLGTVHGAKERMPTQTKTPRSWRHHDFETSSVTKYLNWFAARLSANGLLMASMWNASISG
jgi:hypothetical protein